MPIVDRATLKSYFETGDRPTQSEFEDLIDSSFNLADDQIIGKGWLVKLFDEYGDSTNNTNGGVMVINKPLGAKKINALRVVGEISGPASGPAILNVLLLYRTNEYIPGLISHGTGFGGMRFYRVIGDDNIPDMCAHFQVPVSNYFDELFQVTQSFELPDFGTFHYWSFLDNPNISPPFPLPEFEDHFVGLEFI